MLIGRRNISESDSEEVPGEHNRGSHLPHILNPWVRGVVCVPRLGIKNFTDEFFHVFL